MGWGGAVYAESCDLTITDCTFAGNQVESWSCDGCSYAGGGAIYAELGTASLTRCLFLDNAAVSENIGSGNFAEGGAALLRVGGLTLTECVFRGNEARSTSDPQLSAWGNEAYGGALACRSAVLDNCVFENNGVLCDGNPDGNIGAGGALHAADAIVTGCLFIDNAVVGGGSRPDGAVRSLRAEDRAEGGGAAVAGGSRFTRSTFSRNSAATGGAAIHLRDGGVVLIDNTIVAFSQTPAAILCSGGTRPELTCSDVFGNAGGDWVGCIADQAGSSGNLAADPLFCQPAIGNYTLDAASPCAEDNAPASCGLIGALGVGCGVVAVPAGDSPAAPRLVRVYPNPLDGDAVLEWRSDAGGAQHARLYDLAGRVILARDLGSRAAGTHRLAWSDLTRGVSLPAGVYFLAIDPPGGSTSREQALRVIVTR